MPTYYKAQWAVVSESRPGIWHTVSQRRSDKAFSCTCEDFFYRHAKDMTYECKHIRDTKGKEAHRTTVMRLAAKFEQMARDLRRSV